MDDDQKRFIVILVLLVLLVVIFLGVVFAIVYAMAKVKQVIAPLRSTVRRKIKGVVKVKGLKGQARKVANNAVKGVKSIASKVRSDLRMLAKQFREQIKTKSKTMKSKLDRGMAILSGDPCSKLDQLWTQHVNLTFYYGALALTSLDPITQEQKAKMDWPASQLLQIQQDLSDLMKTCVSESERPTLTQLLKDHIMIVAQIASKWREAQSKNPTGPLHGFDTDLVQAWYKNAQDTVTLLESRTGHQNNHLRNAYKSHLDQTAAYLSEMTKTKTSKRTFELFAEALDHVPMLASTFCTQMIACSSGGG